MAGGETATGDGETRGKNEEARRTGHERAQENCEPLFILLHLCTQGCKHFLP